MKAIEITHPTGIVWATATPVREQPLEQVFPSELVYPARTLLVLAGIPGAGKSHLARRLLTHVPVLEADAYITKHADLSLGQAVGEMTAEAERRVATDPVLVLDATGVNAGYRYRMLRMAGRAGLAPHLLAVDATEDECTAGQIERGRMIPDQSMRSYLAMWDVLKLKIAIGDLSGGDPEFSEGFDSATVLDRAAANALQAIRFQS